MTSLEKNNESKTENGQVDKSPDRIRGMFNETAARYDLLNHLLSFGIDFYWRRQTVRQVMKIVLPQKGETLSAPILDVAAGTGDLSLGLYRGIQRRKGTRPASDPYVLGVDFSPEMLAIAKEKASRKKLESEVIFQEADGLNLPFESDRFSAVTIAFGLRNMSDTDRGISEMIRVCRPGGVVAILEFTMPTFLPYAVVYRFYFKYILPVIGRIVSGRNNRAYEYLPQSVVEFDNREKMKERLQKAGLTDVQARSMTFGTATLYQGTKTTS